MIMLKDNVSVFMGRTIPILTDCNIDIKRVLVEIIGFVYSGDFIIAESDFDIKSFIKNILIFTDGPTREIQLTSNDFKVLDDTKRFFKFLKDGEVYNLPPLKIWNSVEMYKLDDNKELMEAIKNANSIILGPINNINPIIFNQILNASPVALYVLFGDERLESPENNNYHYRYLTNSNCSIDVLYYEDRVSSEKRVNSVINKLRKNNVKFSDLSATVVKVFETDDIDIQNIITYLEEPESDNIVIVPDRLYDKINSLVYDSIIVDNNLEFKVGQRLYLTQPFIVKKNMSREYEQFIIDPFTEIFVTKINNKSYTKHSIYYSIDFQVRRNGKLVLVEGALVDWTHYLCQFKKDYHPDNESDYNIIEYKSLQLVTNKWSSDVLKVIPFRITTSEYLKYKFFERVIIYLESVDSWMLEKHTTNLYNYLSHMTKEAIMYKSFMFTNLEEF